MRKREKFSDELRRYADMDSRAGEPLGIRMRDAADRLEKCAEAIEDAHKWLCGGAARKRCKAETLNELIEKLDIALLETE